jgi:hypothetical protein
LPPFVDVTIIFLHETDESGFREEVSLKYAAGKNESRWERGIPLFQVGLVHAFIGHRTTTPEEPSWFVGLSRLSRSSSQTIEIDQRDQIDQIAATRREMVSGQVLFPQFRIPPFFFPSQSPFSTMPWLASPFLIGLTHCS